MTFFQTPAHARGTAMNIQTHLCCVVQPCSHLQSHYILKSKDPRVASSMNKIQAINTYSLPVIRYPAGILSWSEADTEAVCQDQESSQDVRWITVQHSH